jgi:hypothetical protein
MLKYLYLLIIFLSSCTKKIEGDKPSASNPALDYFKPAYIITSSGGCYNSSLKLNKDGSHNNQWYRDEMNFDTVIFIGTNILMKPVSYYDRTYWHDPLLQYNIGQAGARISISGERPSLKLLMSGLVNDK